ncbi:MAG TPA: RNA polymerase subunit sigma-24, partial [Clostridia bacterium]|nr:RNA polymerase subunit sigma-24 [Clostridia bacterium]
MKNYTDSNYAINKFSKGIVYRFTNKIIEITLERYLAVNPEKTEIDFLMLKALSNEIYHNQDKSENSQTKKNTSYSLLEETDECSTQSLEDEYFASLDKNNEPTFIDGISVL